MDVEIHVQIDEDEIIMKFEKNTENEFLAIVIDKSNLNENTKTVKLMESGHTIMITEKLNLNENLKMEVTTENEFITMKIEKLNTKEISKMEN